MLGHAALVHLNILSCEKFTLNIFDQLRKRWPRANRSPTTLRSDRPVEGALSVTIQNALAAAGLDGKAAATKEITDTIQQALTTAGLFGRASPLSEEGEVVDELISKVDLSPESTDGPPSVPVRSVEATDSSEFLSRSFSNAAGTRTYKLYIPASYANGRLDTVPMVVMLHGCTQSPDDFAVGTRMNDLAEWHGFLVVYPAQTANANGSKCWNWFRREDQRRDRGEPSLIAGITRDIATNYRVDERRIFVAGLSAGAAMAVILGATYPELFAAVGAHSGLPYGAAHDVPSAFGAMKAAPLASARLATVSFTEKDARAEHGVPTIVFHGDKDNTVDVKNGAAIIKQRVEARADQSHLRVSTLEGMSGGRTYSRTVYEDPASRPVMEQWILHGAGHAWSGGSTDGSFTDAIGPDASAEMIRFFNSAISNSRCNTHNRSGLGCCDENLSRA